MPTGKDVVKTIGTHVAIGGATAGPGGAVIGLGTAGIEIGITALVEESGKK